MMQIYSILKQAHLQHRRQEMFGQGFRKDMPSKHQEIPMVL